MEITELKAIWQAYDDKLERSLQLNLHCLEAIQVQKVRSRLTPLFRLRCVEIILYVAVIYWLSRFLFQHASIAHFAFPAAILLFFYIFAMAGCIKQIVLIKQIDYSESITVIQKKLALLQAGIVDYIRLAFLVIPTYLAYPIIGMQAFLGFDIVKHMGNNSWWMAQLVFSACLLPVCIWLYTQVTYSNIHKKWVKFIVSNSAGKSAAESMKFVKELDELKLNA